MQTVQPKLAPSVQKSLEALEPELKKHRAWLEDRIEARFERS